MKIVDFYFSTASRYSYLASTQLDKIAAQTACEFRWLPVNNRALMERHGSNPFEARDSPSGQYEWSYREYDATCWADYYGVSFVEPVNFRRDPPYLVRGCYAAESCGSLKVFCQRLFKAIFVESRVVKHQDLVDFAKEVGISRAAFESAFDDPLVAKREREVLEQAIGNEIFGVPTFMLNGKRFWGNDRLPLLIHMLSR